MPLEVGGLFGVLAQNSTVTILRVLITDNHDADGWIVGTGGGILVDGGSVTMSESVVANLGRDSSGSEIPPALDPCP